MRRQDREVTDHDKILDILKRCETVRLGFWDGQEVYIVPLSFGWEEVEGTLRLWFHGAKEGRKVDLIRSCPRVSFEADTHYKINPADEACGYSARFQSLIGNGTVRAVEDDAEKRHGLTLIMAHYTGKSDWDFPDARVRAVGVYCLEVEKMTCKEHQ